MATEIAHEVGTPLAVVRGRAEQVCAKLADAAGAEDLRRHHQAGRSDLVDHPAAPRFLAPLPLDKRSVVARMDGRTNTELLQLKLRGTAFAARYWTQSRPSHAHRRSRSTSAGPGQPAAQCLRRLSDPAIACRSRHGARRTRWSSSRSPIHGCGIAAEHLESSSIRSSPPSRAARGRASGFRLRQGSYATTAAGSIFAARSGRGTTVTVLWPASPPPRKPPMPKLARSSSTTSPRWRRRSPPISTSAGFETQIAGDGAGALEQFVKEPTDVVVTDLRMKGGDGLDLLSGIKQAEPGDAGDHHDRLRRRRERGGGDATRRLSLRDQALRAGDAALAGRARLPGAGAVARERAAAPDAPLEHFVAATPGEQPADAAAARR